MSEMLLGDAVEIFDGPHATPQRIGEGPYFLNIASLDSGRLDLAQSDHVSREDFRKWTRRVTPRTGDLLFSYETKLGEAALMPSGVEACLGRRMALMRPRVDLVDPRFMLYYYLSPEFQEIISRRAIHGATVSRIGLATMPGWPVSLPSLAAQKAVAGVLGALDDKIAANGQIWVGALALARATFALDLTSVEFEHLTLGDMSGRAWLQLGDGYRTKASEHGQPGLRILRAGDVKPDRIVPDGPDHVSDRYATAIGAKASRPGDVVVTTKGTVGRVAVVPDGIERVVYSPQLCFFRVADEERLVRGFVSGWFRSGDFAAQAETRMFKSDMAPYINLQDIRSLTMPVPVHLADQRRIAQVQVAFERTAHAVERENRTLAATRDALLPLLISGKIRVKDAEKVVEEVL